ncbi:MAG: radical SAM protein [Candidatus Omnitrophica bacterium]|nr:radical SAM protein [Candidatus Omnitrophota bacterium]MDD5352670.1 radical SAM protein [Candidatus Omnitrophota bacterium]MDD5550269.1 radical SAM protein [Candidatus Omnitrophota bacterium]
MDKLLQFSNVLVPEYLKLKLVSLYRKLPFTLPHIILHPTLLCNYQCSYCLYPKYLDKDNSVFKTNIPYQEWLVLFDKFPRSTITISGGEPLLYKDLDRLILGLAKTHIISQVISNISTNLDVLVRAKKANFRLMASFHGGRASLDEFSKNLLYLKKQKLNITVNFVGTNENLKDFKYYEDYFKKKLKVFFRVDAYEDLNREIKDLKISIHGINYILDREKYNNYKSKSCLGGSKYFIVKPNADVYRCHSGFMYINSKEYKKVASQMDLSSFLLGNLKDPDFKLRNITFICHSPCRGVCDIELAAVKLSKEHLQ